MQPAETITGIAFEDTDIALMARIRIDVSSVATYLQQSHVTTITWEAFLDSLSVASGIYLAAANVFDTLQTGSIWTVDKKGFNFKGLISRLVISAPASAYVIPVKFKLAVSGYEFYVRYKIKTKSVSE